MSEEIKVDTHWGNAGNPWLNVDRSDGAFEYAFKHGLAMAGIDPNGRTMAHLRHDPITGQTRTDSSDAFFMLRQLTSAMKTTYDQKYPGLIARDILPLATEIDPGAELFAWKSYDRMGQAKVVTTYADDSPNIEVFGKEYFTRILSLGASYQYSIQDIRKASMAGVPLETKKAVACRRAQEELLERIVAFGLSGATGTPNTISTDTVGVFGLANNPALVSGIYNTSVNWTSSSVANILADFNVMQNKIFNNSKGIHKGTTLLCSTSMYSFLNTSQRSVTFTNDTIGQYLIESSPWLEEIIHWPLLDLAGKKQDTTTAGPRMILMERNAENAAIALPLDFEQLPPQPRNMAFVIPTHMRTGGVTMRYPLAFQLCDGAEG